jgi:ATP-dependent 26S proteasome regulatory subunit
LTLSQARSYANKSEDREVRDNLLRLITGLDYFSKKGVQPSVEFVIPIKR